MYQEPHSKVREAVSWLMGRICEHHSGVVSNQQTAEAFIPRLIEGIKDKPRISGQCCDAFQKLAHSCAALNDEASNCITPYFQETL